MSFTYGIVIVVMAVWFGIGAIITSHFTFDPYYRAKTWKKYVFVFVVGGPIMAVLGLISSLVDALNDHSRPLVDKINDWMER